MPEQIVVPIEVLEHAQGLALPAYATDGSVGMDVLAAIADPLVLSVGERKLVPTGIKIAVPAGYEAQIRPRSGLAIKKGMTCLNTPGTIDSDYRGEVGVILVNFGSDLVEIQRGDRIAQIIFAPVVRAQWELVPQLEETARGEGGFGHTGEK